MQSEVLLQEYRSTNESESGKERRESRNQLTIASLREDILQFVEENQVIDSLEPDRDKYIHT